MLTLLTLKRDELEPRVHSSHSRLNWENHGMKQYHWHPPPTSSLGIDHERNQQQNACTRITALSSTVVARYSNQKSRKVLQGSCKEHNEFPTMTMSLVKRTSVHLEPAPLLLYSGFA